MQSRQPLPRLWLMTDERMGAALWTTLEALPGGSGVIFRHYAVGERRALFEKVRRVARRRRLVLILAGSPQQAAAWRADGAHGHHAHKRASRPLLRTAPAHGRRDVHTARQHLILLSPVFATRSHPHGNSLGRVKFGLWARGSRVPVVALGGMNPDRFRGMTRLGAYGWAAIDALTRT